MRIAVGGLPRELTYSKVGMRKDDALKYFPGYSRIFNLRVLPRR